MMIESLIAALYNADDSLDKIITLALVHRVPTVVKNISKTLDNIISCKATELNFQVDYQPPFERMEATRSYVNASAVNVIGREDDKQRVLDKLLLDSNAQEPFRVLTIVGMEGLGKTTLADLIYNDPKIEGEFPLRLWVDGNRHLNANGILRYILKSATGENDTHALAMDDVLTTLRKKLDQDKFFLVLDDLWTESGNEWLELIDFLKGSSSRARGSRVLVTTQLGNGATAVGSDCTYDLTGLSEEASWRLFEMIVGEEQANRSDLVEFGRAIVKRSHNIPLAIKVVASLLRDQDEQTWQSIQQCQSSETTENYTSLRVLKLCYNNLSPTLRICFSCCALFPKGFVFTKEKLISLWMAQDFIEPLDRSRSIEELCEEHFRILARRCFFQIAELDEYGEIVSCKIHNLMHDLAALQRNDICSTDSVTSLHENRIHHLYDRAPYSRRQNFFTGAKIRTYLQDNISSLLFIKARFPVHALLAKWKNLRALDLHSLGIRKFPNTIGILLHLRYLSLSGNFELEVLPESIVGLVNLQTLDLRNCSSLIKLPNDLNKLAKLRALDVYKSGLKYMPPGMERLTCLSRLIVFVVAVAEKQSVGKLEDLRALKNLRGHLTIQINGDYMHVQGNCQEGGYISSGENISDISIEWDPFREILRSNNEEFLLEDLQPHCNLRGLEIKGYHGVRIPRWARDDSLASTLPNLVKIVIEHCHGLQELPWLGELRWLKILQLKEVRNLEYVENTNTRLG